MRVHVVTDPEFGSQLANIAATEPIWVVQSPANDGIVADLRRSGRDVTTFTPTHSVEELMPIVREHHPDAEDIEVHQ